MAREQREESSLPEKSASATVARNSRVAATVTSVLSLTQHGCCITVARLRSLGEVRARRCSVVATESPVSSSAASSRVLVVTRFCCHYSRLL